MDATTTVKSYRRYLNYQQLVLALEILFNQRYEKYDRYKLELVKNKTMSEDDEGSTAHDLTKHCTICLTDKEKAGAVLLHVEFSAEDASENFGWFAMFDFDRSDPNLNHLDFLRSTMDPGEGLNLSDFLSINHIAHLCPSAPLREAYTNGVNKGDLITFLNYIPKLRDWYKDMVMNRCEWLGNMTMFLFDELYSRNRIETNMMCAACRHDGKINALNAEQLHHILNTIALRSYCGLTHNGYNAPSHVEEYHALSDLYTWLGGE